MPFKNKKILVTGGTGSFGTVFIKTLLAEHDPKEIIIYSRDELKQFEQNTQLNDKRLKYTLGDVRDAARLRTCCSGVDIIVHAAALKQIVAAEYNPSECIRTNVIGAMNVISAAIEAKVSKVIALSTDKAVNPINLYGATKLCSDKLFCSANIRADRGQTIFSVVRYGNVIGSRGSVIPFFKEKAREGKIPITDPRMTRFWITLENCVKFVTECLDRMKGGEVFVSKIPSMKITDLAKAIAPDCPQEIIGIRPGEKLHEIMIPRDEARRTLEFNNYFAILPDFSAGLVSEQPFFNYEKGTPVDPDFEYTSNENTLWVTLEELRNLCG